MTDLEDIRRDIIEDNSIPSMIYVYREDTQEVTLNLLKPSSEIESVSFNSDALPYSLALSVVSTTETTSVWKLTIDKYLTTVMQPKTYNFSVSIKLVSGLDITLYKGLMAVNNRIFSNYSNNAFVAPVLKFVDPTSNDYNYLNGSIWLNTTDKKMFVLMSNIINEAVWEEVAKQSVIAAIIQDIQDMLNGAKAFSSQAYAGGATQYYDGQDMKFEYRGISLELSKLSVDEVEPVSGLAFTKGDIAQYAGGIGLSGKKLAKIAVPAEIEANPHLLLGIVTQLSVEGHAILNWSGELTNIDTSLATIGQLVYFDTLTGGHTLVKPVAPKQVIVIGFVSKVGVLDGKIKIRFDIAKRLSNMYDVYYNSQSLDEDSILTYDFANQRWKITSKVAFLTSIDLRLNDIEAVINSKESSTNKITTITSEATNEQYVGAKALYDKFLTKVETAFTIAGLEMTGTGITLAALKLAIGEATTLVSGLLSPSDKTLIDVLRASFETDDGDNMVNTIKEVLAAFSQFPEGTDIATMFATKVDKVEGKDLSENDLTDSLKLEYDAAVVHANRAIGDNPHATTFENIVNKPTTLSGYGISDAYDKTQIDTLVGDINTILESI